MRPPKRNKRLLSLAFIGISLSSGAFLILSALGQNVSYFFTPIQIENGEADAQTRLRLGGLVAQGSVVRGKGTETVFRVTDGAAHVTVRYTGILPDLFREGQGVIAQGEFDEARIFNASTILAKHDENYKPKELVDGLEAAKAQTASYQDMPLSEVSGPKTSEPIFRQANYTDLPGSEVKLAAYQDTIPARKPIAMQRSGHVSKKFISQNCAAMTLDIDNPVTGAAFITHNDNPDTAFLAFSHGDNGASLYDMSGQRLWHIEQKVDVVSSFGDTLLMYRGEGETSVLERTQLSLDGQMGEMKIESPSEIAPTTLQRSSIASLGPVIFKDNGILFEHSFVKLKTRPTAIAATTSTFGPSFKNGAVVIGLETGDVQIWEKKSILEGCS